MSNVTNMSYMFHCASSFNQDVSEWDVSNVTNMSYMFHCASSFNQDVSEWDVSNVTDIYYSSSFNQDVSNFRRQESGVEFSKLKVGDKVDCLDSSNRWAEAEIIKISKSTKQVLVSYLYWGNEWDEWVSDVSYNLAPLKTHTYYAGGPLEIGFRVEVLHDNVWREGFIMNKKGDKVSMQFIVVLLIDWYIFLCLSDQSVL